MRFSTRILTFTALLLGLSATAQAQRVFFEDFEGGGTGWMPSAGIWEVGTPTKGPADPHSGFQCAGTVIHGNYDPYQDSRFVYPRPSGTPIQLPAVIGDEELRLRYWTWLSYFAYDYGYAQVSYWDPGTSAWSAYETVPGAKRLDGVYGTWHLRDVDLTSYAGMEVKIGFFHTADRGSSSNESTGWYLDDVEIIKILPIFSGDFESGWDYWTVEDALWEVGAPTAGPPGPPSGYLSDECAGTKLDGNYQGYRDSRLISPSVVLPTVSGSQKLFVSYYQWWSYSSYDSGKVQASSLDPVTNIWSAWTDLTGGYVSGVSRIWTPRDLELTSYAG